MAFSGYIYLFSLQSFLSNQSLKYQFSHHFFRVISLLLFSSSVLRLSCVWFGWMMAPKVGILVFALCVLPAIVSAIRPNRSPFVVRGRVYCDPCRAGFETSLTSYIPGAKVRLECRERRTMELVYTKEGTTDSTGTYEIPVNEDHKDQVCDCTVVSSNLIGCIKPSPGRDRARVSLTAYNGIANNIRHANAIGFDKDEPLSRCAQVLRQYQEFDD